MPEPSAKVRWSQPDGKPVSCVEKVKVLNENLEEMRVLCQEALEDAILMGCDPDQVKGIFHQTIDGLVNPYKSDRK
mgnify:CR=1 FL=1|jgi:predicted DNA-binding protein (UPF0251 family)